MDIIKEACSRTIAQTAQPSFKYAEGILSKWKKENVRTPDDIHGLDEQHRNVSDLPKKVLKQKPKPLTNSTISISANMITPNWKNSY